MKLGSKGLAIIKKWEGYHKRLPDGRCEAYLDKLVRKELRSPGYEGLWTIGYGCTEGVYEGLVWTEKQAEAKLMVELNKHVGYVNNLLGGAHVNQNQFDALVSFSYNLGPGWLKSSKILKHIKEGNPEEGARYFMSYVNAGGRRVQGLVNRRNDEMKLFLTMPTQELVQVSRRLSWSSRIKAFFLSLGIGSYFSWENIAQAKQFMQDNAGIMLLGAGLTAFLGYKALEYFSHKEYEEGRYTPSKANEIEEVEVEDTDLPQEYEEDLKVNEGETV